MRKNREVAIFVYRGDEHLVAHRTADGRWNVIAGQVEDGETYAEAAMRELAEETGLAAPLIDLDLRGDFAVDPASQHLYAPAAYTISVAVFAVEAPDGWEPTLDHEHSEYRWCSFDDALALLHWPETRDALREVVRRLPRATS